MGQVLGAAGGSLNNSDGWLANQAAGRAGVKGEKQTAVVLGRWAAGPEGVTVLHDLSIPIANVKANIDHVVVYGDRVLIIDSKTWKPGTYWTAFGRTFRGTSRFSAADKKTLPMARDALSNYLLSKRIRATFDRPELVVWSSQRAANPSLTWYRPAGARAVLGDTLAARRVLSGPANTDIVTALRGLLLSR